jgi:heme exporter protein A
MNEPSIAIQTIRLSRIFGDRQVLHDVDLAIAAGESVALTGSNGSGKTTLLRCLAALDRPSSGEVFWFGRRAASQPGFRKLVGMLSHESRLYGHLTLRENLLFAARMCALPRPRPRVDALLDQAGLKLLADRAAAQVSKGIQQRLAMIRALIHEPPILLLDEPFSGLDGPGRDWLSEWLRELRNTGRAICFSTHDTELAGTLADRILTLRNGSLIAQCQRMDTAAPGMVWRDAA